MSFINVFGGSTLQSADVAYRAIALTANLQLAWPPLSQSPSDVAARTMDVSPSAGSLSLSLPPANQVSTGYDLLISNRGASSFTVKDNGGGTIIVIAPGASKYIQVTDNTSPAGVWNTIAFGAVTAAADASSLVNNLGVAASGPYLYASQPTTTFSSGNTIAATDRAKVYVWTGGAGTQTLPAVGSVGTDFWYEVRNQGTGTLTLAANGAELIDGASTIVFQPTESAVIHGGVGNWYTVGRGRSVQFSFTLLVKSITGGTVTLTSTEAANVVQRYTGTLTSNANIVLPPVVQVYYVSNQTTGAFSVTFKTASAGATVSVPTGQNAVLFCDGTNVINTSTTVSGLTSLTLAQGSTSVPSLNYSGDTSTGLYQASSGHVNVSITGAGTADFSSTGLALTGALSATTGAFSGLVTAATVPTLPAHLTNKAYVDAQVSGGGFLPLAGGTMTGTILANTTEALRITNAAGIITGYNAANSVRTGYLQFASAGSVNLQAEVGTLSLKSQAGFGVQVDITGQVGVGAAPLSTLYAFSSAAGSIMMQTNITSDAGMRTKTTLGDFIAGTGIGIAQNAWIVYDLAATTERMRIDSFGNLNVNFGAASFSSTKLWVRHASNKVSAFYYNGGDPTYAAFDNSGTFISNRIAGAGVALSGDSNSTPSLQVGTDNSTLFNFSTTAFPPTMFPLTYANSAATNGQSATRWLFNGVEKSRMRADFQGNMAYVTIGGDHDFFVNGDSGTGSLVFTIKANGQLLDGNSNELGYKGTPLNNPVAAYTLVQGDNGKKVAQSGVANVTTAAGMSNDWTCVVINASGSTISLIQGASTTIWLAGTTTTGTRTLANRAMCTVTHIGSNVLLVSGAGVT